MWKDIDEKCTKWIKCSTVEESSREREVIVEVDLAAEAGIGKAYTI